VSVAFGASCFVGNVFGYDPTDTIMDGGMSTLFFMIALGISKSMLTFIRLKSIRLSPQS
jgi:hypothetical protein